MCPKPIRTIRIKLWAQKTLINITYFERKIVRKAMNVRGYEDSVTEFINLAQAEWKPQQ
jgi:hypothetical protein